MMNKKCAKCLHRNFCVMFREGTSSEIEACDKFRSATRALTRDERQKLYAFWNERGRNAESEKKLYDDI